MFPSHHHHHHHHHHQTPFQYVGALAHSSSNHHVVAHHHHHNQQHHHNLQGVNRGNNGDDSVASRQQQQLADRANFLIHKDVNLEMLEQLYNQSQDKAEATIKYYLQEHALPFLKMFLECFHHHINLGQSFVGRSFFHTFSSIIDTRLTVMNNSNYEVCHQYYSLLEFYYEKNKIGCKPENRSGLLVALGRACFILEHSLRWKSTQLYVLSANVLQDFLDSANSFIEQELSSKSGENAFYEEKYGSVTSDDRQHIEKVILQKQKRGEDPNFDVIKGLFILICANKTVAPSQPFTLPIHFVGYFVRIVNNIFHFIDPMPLRMFYVEHCACIPFDANRHRVQVDPEKEIPQFSFHNDDDAAHLHHQSSNNNNFNLVDGLFLIIESSTSLLSSSNRVPFIYLSACFNSLMTFGKYCAAPLVNNNILQVTDDARNYHDPFSSSSSSSSNSNSTSIVNVKKVPTKNRLLQLAHYLHYFVCESADGSCSKVAHQAFQVLNLLIWKCSMGVFRKKSDVETLFSVGFQSREIASTSSPSTVQNFHYSFNEIIDLVLFYIDTSPALNCQFYLRSSLLQMHIIRGHNSMMLKKALSSSSASTDTNDDDDDDDDNDEGANSDETDEVEQAFFQSMQDNFDSELAGTSSSSSSSSQNANDEDYTSSNNNNNHPAPPAPVPPSDDDHQQINRITPASPSRQQPQRNLPDVTLPAPATVAPPPRPPHISDLEMLTQLYLKHVAECSSIVFATSNHHMVVFERLINNNNSITVKPLYEDLVKDETVSSETKVKHLLRDGAVATILRRYPSMSFDEQKNFKEILRDCDRSHTAHSNKIDRDFDKKFHRNYLVHNPDGSFRFTQDYNYFETTPPSILKKQTSLNIQRSRFLRQNSKRCRWNKVVAADFAGETEIAFGRWISQRCTAPGLPLESLSAKRETAPGSKFAERLKFSSWKETKKPPTDTNNNNNTSNAQQQQHYGSGTLGVRTTNDNKMMMSGDRRGRNE